MNPDVTKLERRARELLSPDVYDFYAGGAGREATLRANQKAWRRVQFLPRVLRDVSAVDTSVVLGSPLDLTVRTPLAVAPTAFHRLAHPDAELASAGAAAQAGALFVLSIRSTCRIEDVGAAVAAAGGSWWFQVYLMHDLDITAGLVRRAAAAGAQALVLTGDTPYVGRKARIADAPISGDDFLVNIGPLADLAPAELAASVTPAHIGWLSEISGGLPVLVKGVLRGDDAAACVDAGAAGVIVSNHGGRQLDRAVPTAVALPAVAARLAAEPVLVDSGIRRAEDAAAALALGARLVFLGRPVLWALACGGADGVRALLDGLTDDLAHVMALAGAASVDGLAGIAVPG
ncbi:MAG: alpha-hydroxy-acid oxidizing protein [Streptosporangiaceae bacterium]